MFRWSVERCCGSYSESHSHPINSTITVNEKDFEKVLDERYALRIMRVCERKVTNYPTHQPLRAARGSAASDSLIIAFVQGAKWWEFVKTGATMWPSDRETAEAMAEAMAISGKLGKLPNNRI